MGAVERTIDPTELRPGDVVVAVGEHEESGCHCDVRVTVRREPPPQVEVVDGESGRVLFTGRLADTPPPWMFWSRVVPDGPIDLPPRYKIRKRSDHGHQH